MKQLSFRHGWQSAQSALGWIWPGTALVSALALVAGAALVEAQGIASASGARDAEVDLVQGVSFGLLLPLTCFALSSRLDSGLDALMWAPWVRHGAERRTFALGRLAVPMALSAAIALLGGSLALALSLAVSDPALISPLGLGTNGLALIAIAALGAASYVTCLGLAQLLAGAWGRALFLLADWLLGSGSGALALPWPRAHLRTLLGGQAVLGFGALSSVAVLTLLTALGLLLYLRRVPH
jgi:hypothetical protein